MRIFSIFFILFTSISFASDIYYKSIQQDELAQEELQVELYTHLARKGVLQAQYELALLHKPFNIPYELELGVYSLESEQDLLEAYEQIKDFPHAHYPKFVYWMKTYLESGECVGRASFQLLSVNDNKNEVGGVDEFLYSVSLIFNKVYNAGEVDFIEEQDLEVQKQKELYLKQSLNEGQLKEAQKYVEKLEEFWTEKYGKNIYSCKQDLDSWFEYEQKEFSKYTDLQNSNLF